MRGLKIFIGRKNSQDLTLDIKVMVLVMGYVEGDWLKK